MVNATSRPLLPPGNDPVFTVQEDVWVPGPVSTGADNLAPTGIRSPDRPNRIESLYRLSYRGPLYTAIRQRKWHEHIQEKELVLNWNIWKLSSKPEFLPHREHRTNIKKDWQMSFMQIIGLYSEKVAQLTATSCGAYSRQTVNWQLYSLTAFLFTNRGFLVSPPQDNRHITLTATTHHVKIPTS
jgi:hypothetical protein